jgi:aryl-alcohol dehydrogenase-like predicted oxidoreductase
LKNKLILGTVQFGIDYGVNNISGKPSEKKIKEILDLAFLKGIRILDTAEAYGDSQNRIGDYHKNNSNKFKILTKYSPTRKDFPKSIIDRVNNNLNILGVKNLYSYMFHSFHDYKKHFPFIKNDLIRLKEESKIQKIGVSLHSNDEIEEVLKNNEIKLVQLPYNLLDNSNKREEVLKKAKYLGVEIHTRSVFLQGLFFKNTNNLTGNLIGLKNELIKLNNLIPKNKMNELALNYIYSKEYIDGVLIGVDNVSQLQNNIDCLGKNDLEELFGKVDQINVSDNLLLNPVNWKK